MKAVTAEIDPSKLAKTSSQKAFATNTPQTHNHAADMHDRAAKLALADGDKAAAKKHKKIADVHRQAAAKTSSVTTSQSEPDSDVPVTDEPDNDGKDENPLLTWATKR